MFFIQKRNCKLKVISFLMVRSNSLILFSMFIVFYFVDHGSKSPCILCRTRRSRESFVASPDCLLGPCPLPSPESTTRWRRRRLREIIVLLPIKKRKGKIIVLFFMPGDLYFPNKMSQQGCDLIFCSVRDHVYLITENHVNFFYAFTCHPYRP